MKWLSYGIAGILMVLALVAGTASMANNVVAASHSNERKTTRTIPELLPAECSSVAVTAYVMGITGTNAPELVMATAAGETVSGGGGDDCLMGGAGVDNMVGGTGNDVCYSGPGTDTFANSCEIKLQ